LCVRLHREQAHSQCRRAATGPDFGPTRAVRFEANVFQLAPPAGALTFSEVEVIQTIN
jgi:hypothetical protein